MIVVLRLLLRLSLVRPLRLGAGRVWNLPSICSIFEFFTVSRKWKAKRTPSSSGRQCCSSSGRRYPDGEIPLVCVVSVATLM